MLEQGADLLHLDVMDGHFAPNLTMGPALCDCLHRALPGAFLDVHLMVEKPEMFVEPFARAGAANLTFHAEVMDPAACVELARKIQGKGMTAGLAINPATGLEGIRDILGSFDMILVMSVRPGFSGQAFMPEVLPKTREVRNIVGAGVRVEMDGGIASGNAKLVRDAGCDVIVAATAVFGAARGERGRVVRELQGP